jgi:hypothetical protein
MAGVLVEEWDDGSGGFFLAGDGSVLREEWERALREASAAGTPVMVLATAFSLVAWMEGRRTGAGPALTPSSLVMETGGYKGRVRSVPKPELYARVAATLQIPEARIVAEYGMTEMLSQFYEPVLVDGSPAAPAERRFVGPPWVATRVLEPSTLEPVPPGEPGLLSHLDLANLDSVAAILTEDEGVEWKDGFRVLGRIRGGEPRGCSLAFEDLLSAGGANG